MKTIHHSRYTSSTGKKTSLIDIAVLQTGLFLFLIIYLLFRFVEPLFLKGVH